MNVLSLFDGISCGRVALDRAGITVDTYYACEIDKHAIKVSESNYPDIVRLGDVLEWEAWPIEWGGIDLLIGGSPCQGFSFAGKQLAFDDPRSRLFFVYVDILNHIKKHNPDVKFLLENVRMKKEFLQVISDYLGVEPIMINSTLVSAQNRVRFYWCNWENEQPEDRGIVLNGILEESVDEKYFISGGQKTRLMDSSDVDKGFSRINPEKAGTMTARQYANWKGTFITTGGAIRDDLEIRRLTPIECERLQTMPDNYTAGVSDSQRYKALGNGWTVDVIAHLFRNIKKDYDFVACFRCNSTLLVEREVTTLLRVGKEMRIQPIYFSVCQSCGLEVVTRKRKSIEG